MRTNTFQDKEEYAGYTDIDRIFIKNKAYQCWDLVLRVFLMSKFVQLFTDSLFPCIGISTGMLRFDGWTINGGGMGEEGEMIGETGGGGVAEWKGGDKAKEAASHITHST